VRLSKTRDFACHVDAMFRKMDLSPGCFVSGVPEQFFVLPERCNGHYLDYCYRRESHVLTCGHVHVGPQYGLFPRFESESDVTVLVEILRACQY
jgi:hypothetical protein